MKQIFCYDAHVKCATEGAVVFLGIFSRSMGVTARFIEQQEQEIVLPVSYHYDI